MILVLGNLSHINYRPVRAFSLKADLFGTIYQLFEDEKYMTDEEAQEVKKSLSKLFSNDQVTTILKHQHSFKVNLDGANFSIEQLSKNSEHYSI